MAQTMKVKKGDVVHVLRGKDAGKEGRVIEARPKEGASSSRTSTSSSATGARARSRTRAAWAAPQIIPGGIIEMAAPLPVSNVMVVCPMCKQPTRVGTVAKTVKDKTVRVRVCKREDCGQEIDR